MANDILLKIEGLRAGVEDKEILKGVDLVIRKGEIHAVMGPVPARAHFPLCLQESRSSRFWTVQ